MIGGYYYGEVALSEQLEQLREHRVPEPTERYAAVGGLVVGQLTYHLRLRSGVAEHVDEVDDEHVQVVVLQRVELLHELIRPCRVVNLVVRECAMAAETFELGPD